MRALCAALVLLTLGCARNAILELDVTIPAQAVVDGRGYALVEVADGVSDFDDDAFALQGEESIEVSGTEARTARFAVMGTSPSTEVRVRVRYCVTPRCDDLDMDVRPFMDGLRPGHRYVFERAFYVGHVTSYEVDVDPLSAGTESAAPRTICRCAVAGCVGRTTTSYCRLSADPCNDDPANTHFCE
jgi:hypothetical protein